MRRRKTRALARPGTTATKPLALDSHQRLAPLTVLDPTAVVTPAKSARAADRFEMLLLALALVFNDLAGVLLMFERINDTTRPAGDAATPEAGEWSGLNLHRHRLVIGILAELFQLLERFKAEATSKPMQALLQRVQRKYREDWADLLAEATGQPRDGGTFARQLAMIRGGVVYHYYQTIPLVEGYFRHFSGPPSPRNEHAFASLGASMEATRFYYADAAVEQALLRMQGEEQSVRFAKNLLKTARRSNNAIRAILEAHLRPAHR